MSHGAATPASPVATRAANRFDRAEWAGAFGDLGTLRRGWVRL